MDINQKQLDELEKGLLQSKESTGFIQDRPFKPVETSSKDAQKIEDLRKVFDKKNKYLRPLELMAF